MSIFFRIDDSSYGKIIKLYPVFIKMVHNYYCLHTIFGISIELLMYIKSPSSVFVTRSTINMLN